MSVTSTDNLHSDERNPAADLSGDVLSNEFGMEILTQGRVRLKDGVGGLPTMIRGNSSQQINRS